MLLVIIMVIPFTNFLMKTYQNEKKVLTEDNTIQPQIDLAEKVREACIAAAREGFMDASISGLCTEGAMEVAISAMESLKLEKILAK